MPEDNSSYPPIADYALISDCRAVCRVGLGSYSMSKPRRWRTLARSVSDWVVRHARCPVLAIGAGVRIADVAGGGFDRISACVLLT
jgi:hypothetical protein